MSKPTITDANNKQVEWFKKRAEKQFEKLFPELKDTYKSRLLFPSDWKGG